ncbi:MAG: glycosyltransferase [Chloroflexota bacterium]|nr:glycosyltransferase [Chloroflexota bacterium]
MFFRTFRKFHGGQLKVWDYFNHVLASPAFTPRIGFSPRSNWDHTNPWLNARDYVVDSWRSVRPDVFFVAGRDWRMLDEHPAAAADIPVVNLVQHVRHANEESTRFEFLQRKAIRVCVSEEVATALRETRLARGPLIVIPNGLDLDDLPGHDERAPGVDALVVALKQPELGEELGRRLRRPGRSVDVLATRLPRPNFLARLRGARTTVFLPNRTEGFYLPALEGMALGTIVVCPDCVGNRSFCLPGHNAFRPDYALEEVVGAAESALTLPTERAEELRANARQTAEAHSLHRERKAFLDVLDDVDRLWRSARDDGAGGRG